ncbi:hypothetical protein [Natronospira bacteriovora]|uniref:Uncharacterized protein n=1 Tax=Natronospira bacteriovora TaxID=3069753 RepID=A0ABU0W8C3_9GAMM|nr:hypothetical protein [Natronospira sp. AB-CW4]MDQ2070251.1 hypothetical protein [Natronospira sp. AB-CW4]
MSERHNDDCHHMDRDACRMFSRGLFLMLTGVCLSVLALLFLPHLSQAGKVSLVLGGVGLSLLLVVWPVRQAHHVSESVAETEILGD